MCSPHPGRGSAAGECPQATNQSSCMQPPAKIACVGTLLSLFGYSIGGSAGRPLFSLTRKPHARESSLPASPDHMLFTLIEFSGAPNVQYGGTNAMFQPRLSELSTSCLPEFYDRSALILRVSRDMGTTTSIRASSETTSTATELEMFPSGHAAAETYLAPAVRQTNIQIILTSIQQP